MSKGVDSDENEEDIRKKEEEEILQMSQSIWQEDVEEESHGGSGEPRAGPSR